MIIRKQYAHNAVRQPAKPTHQWVWRDRSRYQPHQGKQEMARRAARG